MCETNLNDSIDSGNLYVGGYLPLIRKYSVTHMHGSTVYVKEGLPSAQNLSVENSQDSYLCFRLALLHSVSFFFFLYRFPLLRLFYLTQLRFSFKTSANVFVFGDFNVRHKVWLNYSDRIDTCGELL